MDQKYWQKKKSGSWSVAATWDTKAQFLLHCLSPMPNLSGKYPISVLSTSVEALEQSVLIQGFVGLGQGE